MRILRFCILNITLFACDGLISEAAGDDANGRAHYVESAQRNSTGQREWQDEIIYVVVIQKFFNGNHTNDIMLQRFGPDKCRYTGGFWGGDLDGIIQKLDYLSSLGVTALLLYPVVANDAGPFGKHLATGYRPKDYFGVDENFGDVRTLRRLVDQAHARKMRVILDLPLGLPGTEHPIYRNPEKAGWFGKPTPYGVKQWNAENPEVADYLIRVSKFWKKETHCDGFRLDSAQLHSLRFWKRYASELKGPMSGNNFFLLAELPLHPGKVGEFLGSTGFDSAYDFSLGITREVFGKGLNVNRLSFVLKEGKQFYPSPPDMCAQIDNYEDPEFITAAIEPREARMRLAMTLLLTLDRIPLIYSGDEIATSYRDVGSLFAPAHRALPFLKFVKSLIALRKKEPTLRRGGFIEVQSHDPVFAFLRVDRDARILVILNNSAERREVSFPLGLEQWRDCKFYDLLSARMVKAKASNTPIIVEPYNVRLLRVSK